MRLPTGYSPLQIGLHWAVAALILSNYVYSEGMGEALDAHLSGLSGGTWPLHVIVGVGVLLLVLLRLVVRLATGAPVAAGSGLETRAAAWGHRLLYLLMIAVPVCGGIAWFGGVEDLGDVHEALAQALIIVAATHAGIAIFHQLVRRDGTLSRMLRPGGR